MTQMTVQQAYMAAVQLQQNGRLADAEAMYRQILAVHPDHPDVICMLGVMAFQVGKRDMGIGMVKRAITLRPNYADFYGSLGGLLAGMGRREEAIEAFKTVIALKPDSPDVLYSMALNLQRTRRLDECIEACRRALQYRPMNPEVYCVLGDALFDKNQVVEAAACYKKTLEQITSAQKLPIQWNIDEAIKQQLNPIFWPEYHGPPLSTESVSYKAMSLRDDGVPKPQVHPDLAYLEEIPRRKDLPTSQELFSLNGVPLANWRKEDLQSTDGDWLTNQTLYPTYFGVFQALTQPGKPCRLLEIGTRTGNVGVALAKGAKGPCTYVGIDPNIYLANSLDYAAASFRAMQTVRTDFDFFLIEGYSWDKSDQSTMMKSGPYDIIHIDGDHTLPGKLIDLELARVMIAPGGYVLVDDYDYEVHVCVKQAVSRMLALGIFKKFGHVGTYRGMAVLQVE